MAYPDQPQPVRARPSVVTAAVWCLFVLAAVQLITVITTLAALGPMIDAARDYAGGTSEGDTLVTGLQIAQYVSLAFGAVFAIGFALLGMFTNRGSNVARIITWVVLGISLCCNGFGLLGAAAGGMMDTSGTSAIDQDELQRRISDAAPWYNPVNYSLAGIAILASLAAVILLALPAANQYFRKVEQVWEPPVPGGYYPAPGTPGMPGDPNQPGQQNPPGPPPPGTGYPPPGL